MTPYELCITRDIQHLEDSVQMCKHTASPDQQAENSLLLLSLHIFFLVLKRNSCESEMNASKFRVKQE